MRRVARVDVAEVVAERVVGDLGQRSGHFDAGGAAADEDEGEPGALLARSFSRSAAS